MDASTRRQIRERAEDRCEYCGRLQSDSPLAALHLEHIRPRKHGGSDKADNLALACVDCNALMGNADISDPCAILTAEHVRVKADGMIEGLTRAARKIIRVRGLDSESCNRWRRLWLRNIDLAAEPSPDPCLELMGFPDDLPELSKLCPPGGNSRLDGIERSYFAQRQRGELPETY